MSLARKGFAAASELVVVDMVASMQQQEVVAESWEPVVHKPTEGSRDMEVVRPGVWVCRRFRTSAALEAVVSHEAKKGILDSCCACLQRKQHWLLAEPAVVEQLELFALTEPQLVAVVAHRVQVSATKSSDSSAAGKAQCTFVA